MISGRLKHRPYGKLAIIMKIVQYLQEVRVELGKVSWPDSAAVVRLTSIILIASLITGLYIGGLDLGFTSILGLFLK